MSETKRDPDLSVKRSALGVERSAAAAAVDAANPWLGLASFTEETRAYFHGRDEDAAELARRVQRKLLTVLFGQSGHGKTSLLRAGLVPRLRDEGYCPVYVRLDYAPESPPPSEQIKSAIFQATLAAGSWTQTGASVRGESLWEFLHHRDDTLKDAAGRTLVPLLIFDQFEEIFTLAQNDDAGRQRAQAFLADLADLVENRPPVELERRIEREETDAAKFDFARADYRILISLREDYLAHLEGLKTQMPSVTQNRVRLARFNGAQALEAVRAPAPELVTNEVATQIVRFVAGGAEVARAEVEPSLLSLICRELNNARLARGQSEITADLLAGSRETILSEFYENALADQPVGVRRYIEDHLLTDSGYRESVAEERVKKAFAAAGANPDALAFLVGRRLLRVEERLDVRRVELTHDVLCGVVKASREVRQEREGKEALERQLAATRATEEATRRALRRARMVAATCAVLAAGAIGSAIFGYLSRRRAVVAEQQAVDAAADAVKARRLADSGRAQAESLMDYMLADLRDELRDLGHAAILREVSQKTVAYYEGLPNELMTTATQIAKAKALGNLGITLSQRGQAAEAQSRLEAAVTMFESLRQSSDWPIAAQIDHASVLNQLARHLNADTRFSESLAITERVEPLLRQALVDSRLRGRALRELGRAQFLKGSALRNLGRPTEAATYYQRAALSSEEADRLPPSSRRPGLEVALALTWLAVVQHALAPADSATANEEARRRLVAILEKEPFLASAKGSLTMVLGTLAAQQGDAWNFDAAEETRDQARAVFDDLLKIDPKNTTLMNNRAVTHRVDAGTNPRNPGGFALRRDFAAVETHLKLAMDGLVEAARGSNFAKMVLSGTHGDLAVLYASVGRDGEADQELATMQALANELPADTKSDSGAATDDTAASNAGNRALLRRMAEAARLNWSVVRADAERALARPEGATANDLTDGGSGVLRRNAARDLMVAAWAMGDYPAARRALTEFERGLQPLPTNPPIARRYQEVLNQLQGIHVLGRAGDLDEARKRLDQVWPEVEAVFAVRPEEVFTQIQMAYGLWVKAEVADGLDNAARRALLERGIGYLRKWAEAGKLTRFDREVHLAGMEKLLETLRGAN